MKTLLLLASAVLGIAQVVPGPGGGGTGTVSICGTTPVANSIAYWSSATAICGVNAPTVDPATGNVSIGGTSLNSGAIDLGAATVPAIGANSFGIGVGPTMTTSQRLQSPNAVAVAHSLMVIGAPSSNISTWAYKAVPDCTDTGGNHLNFTQSTDAFSCGTSGGGATPGTGGADFFWGAPAYTMSGAGNVVNPGGFAHGGISFTFYARVQTISKITYKVTAAAASGSGMIVGIYTANQSSAVCSAVASGTSVTTTGFKSLSISGCTGLVIGQPYTIILSSDDTTLALESYGDAYSFGFQNEGASAGVCGTTTACRAGYDATVTAGVVSTGTGASLAFNTLSAVSWTSLPDATATFRLVLGFVN